ncbi:o-succinylbenzoate synthase [Candidatus Spyradosoma sp. SGI.093]|uniref:o-succinylbenzoate synthase n=1 Tax=Candidatus Spyradosoma sp. SGI.093 TaxID=3420583 RepID=UPI003D06C750
MNRSPLKLAFEHVSRPFRVPVKTARGTAAARETIVVSMRDEAGRVGRGEIAPWGGFGCETLDAAEAALRALAEHAGKPESLADAVPARLPCTRHALAAAAFFLDNPAEFAAPEPTPAAVCRLIPRDAADAPETLAEKIRRAHAEGFRAFKIKIGLAALADEVALCDALLRLAAESFPDARLRFDANGAWRDDALDALAPLAAFPQLEFVEQPLAPAPENDAAVLALPRERAAKIALDESLREPWTLPDDAPVVAVVKPLLVGDFPRLRAWLRRENAAPRFVLSSVFETDVGRSVLRALCARAADNPRALAAGVGTLAFFRENPPRH